MSKLRVLFLAANPKGTTPLKLDEEIRAITQKIRAAEYRETVELLSTWAVRPDDLLQYLNEHKPQIVHFSGHGYRSGEILLVDNNGIPKSVSVKAIQALFTTLKDNIRLVLLNACYSKIQAQAITEVIDCVIGMNTAVGNNAAIIFAASFYRAIGFGRSIQEAFDQGKTALLLDGLVEENTPELLSKRGVDPSRIFLVAEVKANSTSTPSSSYASGLSYLKRSLYDLAISNFEKAVEVMPGNADSYYYYALSSIRGKRPKSLTLKEVKLIEKYIETAIQLDDSQAKYYYLLAILKFDYYLMNGLSVSSPSVEDLLRIAQNKRYDSEEIEILLQSLILRDQQLLSIIHRT